MIVKLLGDRVQFQCKVNFYVKYIDIILIRPTVGDPHVGSTYFFVALISALFKFVTEGKYVFHGPTLRIQHLKYISLVTWKCRRVTIRILPLF